MKMPQCEKNTRNRCKANKYAKSLRARAVRRAWNEGYVLPNGKYNGYVG